MNEEEAIITLARDLVDKGFWNVVSEETLKAELLKDNKYIFLWKKGKLRPIVIHYDNHYRGNSDSDILSKKAKEYGANYFFITNDVTTENNEGEYIRLHFRATPLAIIGEKEKLNLKQQYQGIFPA